MSIAVNVVSAALKSVVENRVENGLAKKLVDISVDEIAEKGVAGIADFINREQVKLESILSRKNMRAMGVSEESIDFVKAEISELLSELAITDEVFRECRYDSEKLKSFMWNAYVRKKGRGSHIERESEIRKCLSRVAEVLSEMMYESDNFSQKVLIQISNSVDDANDQIQKLSDGFADGFGKLRNNDQAILEILNMIQEQIQNRSAEDSGADTETLKNNKKQAYLKMWNDTLFLHGGNETDPVTLADAFIMPDYEMHKSIGRIGFSREDTLDEIIKKFVKFDKTSTLLIAGVPGIGKSSITSWIANQYKEDDTVIILRFRDWEKSILENSLLDAVCSTLECKKKDLESKILVLDGFDEMKALHVRDQLLDALFMDMKDFENLKCIITSRSAYIDSSLFHNVLELKGFDMERIELFVRIITGKPLKGRAGIKSNLEVLGIPVILYMALMSHIDISKRATKPELYHRIFAEKGGIFDRFYDGAVGYSVGGQILSNRKNIEKYLGFLQKEVAFKMFEKDDLSLRKEECQISHLVFEEDFVSVLEFPIKYLFENTASSIEFIHKSIYEYFVAEYIFTSIKRGINISKEELAGVLGTSLKKNLLSEEIIEFLQYDIKNDVLNSEFYVMHEVFQLMQRNGMTYYMQEVKDTNIIQRELMVFANMLKLMHLWTGDIVLSNLDYLKYNIDLKFDLMGMDLSSTNLTGVDLRKADLRRADLKGAILARANLRGADLRGADLTRTDLRGADLRNAKIEGAAFERTRLDGTILDEVQVNKLKNKCTVCNANVCIKDIDKIISYEVYQKQGRNVI